jgi:uncharacterized membrane protein YphA (DoxX/SURF4 family)
MTDSSANRHSISALQRLFLVILRLAIGWHILYEGVAKRLMEDWTAAGYLESATGPWADLFHWMASHAGVLKVVDFCNVWGLIAIGLGLVLGLFTRLAALAGVLLLLLYYAAHPPLMGSIFGVPSEGHYIIVNKNLVEMVALMLVAVFPTGQYAGLDGLLRSRGRKRRKADATPSASSPCTELRTVDLDDARLGRRETLKGLAGVPVLGALFFAAARKHRWDKLHAITGATIQVSSSRLKDLNGELPQGQIGGHRISRLIMGGNLIGGWAHSRDLHYVSTLFKAYNTEKKVFETLMLGEKAGINAINIVYTQLPLINKYRKMLGSAIKTTVQVHPTRDNVLGDIKSAIDNGGDLIQIQGSCSDWRVRDGEIDVLAEAMDYIRDQGYPVGLGAHSIQALIACEQAGLTCDFYMKTMHHDHYWSAHPKQNRIPFSVDTDRSPDHDEFHDNMFCLFPEETVEFMRTRPIPLIGFKVLAGGAIDPEEGFRYAFVNGVDFICVGMFDYQIVDDVNIVLDVLRQPVVKNRVRAWYA